MKRPRGTVWIDDNPSREGTAKDLGARFVDVKNREVSSTVEKLLKGPRASLVILDHVLDKTRPPSGLLQRGSTIAEAIKEAWPWCPVVGVTASDNMEDIDLRTKGVYDALFSFQDLRQHMDELQSIRSGFQAAARKRLQNTTQLVRLLTARADETKRLQSALPEDLRDRELLRDPSVGSRLHRWVDDLRRRAGFLYDKLWTATFLGLNESGLEIVKGKFERSLYRGVFWIRSDPRWWSTNLSSQLYKSAEAQRGELSWNVGRRLEGITRRHFSRCYLCDDSTPPETVAYLDVASKERYPAHLKCTELHPRFKRELYFEDVRVMKAE